ncbi:MAG: hypothetical protein IJS54_07975 [Desulfovibrio sp.]|nr:hypothetical protein [Desulfovibrio sp.]
MEAKTLCVNGITRRLIVDANNSLANIVRNQLPITSEMLTVEALLEDK